MKFTFSRGAKIVRVEGDVEDLEGVEFTMRPMTNFVRIQAARAVKRMDSTEEIELARASVATVKGAAVKDWDDWSHCNAKASADVNRAMGVVNGWLKEDGTPVMADVPLESPRSGSAPT